MAFNLPMVHSDIIQFAEPGKILMHRLTYLLLGFGFIFATIRFLNRLPQTGGWNSLNVLGFILFVAAGGIMGTRYYMAEHHQTMQREIYLDLNKRYAERNVADISACDLDVVQQGKRLQIRSDIRFSNPVTVPLDTLIFSLNPGFVVDSIHDRKGSLAFTREEQILLIFPSDPIQPGRRGRVTIHYHGIPDENIANLDIPKKELAALKRITVAPLDKKAGIVDDNYVLLTPEMLWYPLAGVGFNKVNFLSPGLDFARYSLHVKPDKGLVPVAPGQSTQEDGVYRFSSAHDLNALPLVIGPFEKRSMEVDEVLYNLYLKPGHDYFSGTFTHIADTMAALITEAKDDYELDDLDLYLLFDQVSLVEVPIQFHAYEHPYTQVTDYVFPGMILIPEKGAGLSTLDFKRYAKMTENRDRKNENVRSPREIEVEMFKRLLQNTFFRSSFRTNRGGLQQGDYEHL